MFSRSGESEVENTSFYCYAADGSLYASLHLLSETNFRVVCGVNCKYLFVVPHGVER